VGAKFIVEEQMDRETNTHDKANNHFP